MSNVQPVTVLGVGLLVLLCMHQSISNMGGVGRKTVFVSKTVRKAQVTKSGRELDLTIMEEDDLAPTVAWVLAYPCTGSDFIIDVIQKLTQRNTATNYGHLVEESSGILSRNVYESMQLFADRVNGPFLFTKHLPIPVKTSIPTLSYCGGYCASCYPGKYIMLRDKFIEKCLTGTKFTPSVHNNGENGYGETTEVHYDGELIKKIGVVVRNPIEVVSTRFMYYSNVYAGDLDFTQRYDQSRDGFLTYCQESKEKFGDEEIKHWPTGFRDAGVDIPCYAEIYKIVQWQNLVCETLDYYDETYDDVPQKYIYYEDFFLDYNKAAEDTLEFYGIANVIPVDGTRPDQVHLNQDLYTDEEKEKIKAFIRVVASTCTKNVFARYGI